MNNINQLELGELRKGDNVSFNIQEMDALGTGGSVNVTGSKLAGKITITTGTGGIGGTPCRINFLEGRGFDTDQLLVIVSPVNGSEKQATATGIEGTGFEIYSPAGWAESTVFQFIYQIIASY